VATAEAIYADPSALVSLYLHQPRSLEVVSWRRRLTGSLPVTHHGRAEMTNAIGLAGFRGDISHEDTVGAWAALDQDFVDGHLGLVPIAWRSAFKVAGELSRKHSPELGTRAADVLHVACALELGLKRFLSFDGRQKILAARCGLRLVKV
jgi:predicted nucleic acid-binding protein